MARVEIIAPKDKADEVVKELLKIKSFQPEDPKTPISQEKVEEARRKYGEINEAISKLKVIMELGGVPLEPKGKMEVINWIDISTKILENYRKFEDKYKELLEEIGKLRAELESLETQRRELEPFKNVGIDLSLLYNTKTFDIALAIITAEQRKELEKRNFVVICECQKGGLYPAIIIGLRGSNLTQTLKELGIRRLETQDLVSPLQAYNNLMERINYIQSLLSERRGKLAESVVNDSEELSSLYGELLTSRDAMYTLSKARVSNYYIQFEGFIPEKDLKTLNKKLGDKAFITYTYPKRFGDEEEPPTYVNLPSTIKPLESVVEYYGTPSYWEISPTVFLVITFPFLFGLMFPDFGNALVVLLFSIWFYNYGKKRGSLNIMQLSLVLIYGSIIAMITGILAREFFGPLPVGGLRELLDNPSLQVGPLYSIWPVSQSAYNTIRYILPTGGERGLINTIILSLLLGAILLFISSLMGVVNAIKKKDSEYLLLDRLPVLLIYTVPLIVFTYGLTYPQDFFGQIITLLGGIEYFIFHSGTPAPNGTQLLADILVIWIELALIYNWIGKMVILRKHEKLTVGGALAIGFIEGAFEAGILLISNTVSFIRVLVFAVAHYYILFAFSYMAYLAAGSPTSTIAVLSNPLGIIILILGNLIAIALEGLIVFIQDMRLHFYEMFSKFYEGRGRKFEPVMAYVELP
jgi:V/A-type H+-transporting ATPase subunit I